MDRVAIDDEQVISMENIAPGVRGLRIAFVNVFALTHPDGSWSLIDAALPFSASHIKNWAEKHFGTAPNSLILTHGHFDHVSAAKDLAASWDIPVYAHLLEFPYLTGQKEYPKPNVGAGGGMMTLLSPLYPRSPINIGERLVALPNEDRAAGASDSGNLADLPGLPGWKILHTPGHTPGHVSFFRPGDRTLVVGDAFCTTKPESFFEAAVAQNAELHGPPSYFTSDWTAASASVRRLASLDPLTVAPGHGRPLGGPDVASALRKLATAFENVAVPEKRAIRSAGDLMKVREKDMQRRRFVTSAVAAAVWAQKSRAIAESRSTNSEGLQDSGAGRIPDAGRIPVVSSAGTMRGEMLYRQLGSTGVEVSVIGMGGSHLGQAKVDEDMAIRLIHQGLDRGINFLDNSWDYNEGRSEERVGKALSQSGYRQKAFVMTKLDGRTKEVAAAQIDTSLKRLKVDHIDLLQHHEILRYDDPDRVFNEGGAMEAVLAAKQAGKVRFIGFTGHKDPHIHLYMLDVAKAHGFHFDTVQMPINIMDAHFRSFSQLVVPRAIEEKIGVLGMKCFGSGVILKSRAVEPMDCLHYSLNLPLSVLITGIDNKEVLDQAFAAVKSFSPMNETEVSQLISKSKDAAAEGKYELFKTTSHFDTTARHPDWLGSDSSTVQKLAPELPG